MNAVKICSNDLARSMKRRKMIKTRNELQTKCIPDYFRRSMCLVLAGIMLILEAGVCALLLLRFTSFFPFAERHGCFTVL